MRGGSERRSAEAVETGGLIGFSCTALLAAGLAPSGSKKEEGRH